MLTQVKKRNGTIVDFDKIKVENAIKKAFEATSTMVNADFLLKITTDVIDDLEKTFDETVVPSVENVQNSVELNLMKEGFYNVAKAYIIYRFVHTKIREEKKEELRQKIDANDFFIRKRDGRRELFSPEKLKRALNVAAFGLENEVEIEKIVNECKLDLYDDISANEVARALILVARGHIEEDPSYSRVAARLLLSRLNKEVIGDDVNFEQLDSQYRLAFIRNLQTAVDIKRIDPELLSFDLEHLSKSLRPERDDLLQYLGAQTMYDRYFLRNPESGKVLESVQAFWMRVSMGLALNEVPEDREKYAMQFYNLISQLYFVPSTPTLFHAGTTHPQLSSCYLTTVEDSLSHIFKSIGDNAQLSKWSGGLGNDWTNIRGTGSLIKGTGVHSQGVVPFLKVANDTTVAINRSGRRRGATCAYLETWHLDIEDFIELRRNTGDERRRTHDMNTANWVPDLFMKRVVDNAEWTLFSPSDTPDLHDLFGRAFERRYCEYEQMVDCGQITHFKRIKAVDLWKRMISMLFETGHPWITFKDPSNIRSPQDHAGVVHSSNLCTEITLNTSAEETAVCNLGSVNLACHVDGGKFNVERVAETVGIAMRMLDNVIDINFYPTREAENSNKKHRPVGLGIMGFQDALFLQNIRFDSEECVDFADYSMEVVAYNAILASAHLAKERGKYASYQGSKWERGLLPVDTIDLLEAERALPIEINRKGDLDWTIVRKEVDMFGMRNSNCMAVAPTATISNIAGCFPSIEPIYKNIYVKSNMSGEFTIINSYLVDDLKKIGMWNREMLEEIKKVDGDIQRMADIPAPLREKYKETFDIEPKWYIKAAAYRGKWIDQSQSLNLFIKGTSGRKISDAYLYAWKMGLKTTYYLRGQGATAIEKSTSLLERETQPLEKSEKIKLTQGLDHSEEHERKSSAEAEVAMVFAGEKKSKLCRLNDPGCEACQ